MNCKDSTKPSIDNGRSSDFMTGYQLLVESRESIGVEDGQGVHAFAWPSHMVLFKVNC